MSDEPTDAASSPPPQDLFDVVCRLDDLAAWLKTEWPDEAQRLHDLSQNLKGYILLVRREP